MDPRRLAPRIAVDGFCAIVNDNVLHPASLVELSPMGLRIALPMRMRRRQTFQIEIELPGADEIIWARGSVAHARCFGTAGMYLEAAAARERRLLRDYVIEMRRAQRWELREGIEYALSALVN